MADGKKSFVLYADYIQIFDQLTTDEAGKLIQHLFRYVNDQEPELDDRLLRILFEPIKQQLKRDLREWDFVKKDRSVAGRIGNIKRWNADLYEKIVLNELSLSEAEEIAKRRKTSQTSHDIANIAVNVTVTDTVTVNVTEIGADQSTQNFYDMLVPEIVEIWLRDNPSYHFNQDLDFHAALRISYQIAGVKKWKKADVLEEKKDECVESWKRISKFIMADNWFSKMTLDSIAGDKIWQKIVVAMQSKSNGNGKLEDADYMVKAREEYLNSKK